MISTMTKSPIEPAALAEEALHIIAEGTRRGIVLRAFGGIGFYMHTTNRVLFSELGRDPINDVDLVGLSEHRNDYKKLFHDLNYHIDWDRLVAGEGRRYLFERSGEFPVEVDLFIDRLDMCHQIELRHRIALQPYTIPLADLLLEKLQIVDLNRKDIVDVVVLLSEHQLEGEGPETIDMTYIRDLLADDWGFYYTARTNLNAVSDALEDLPLDGELREGVTAKLRRLDREIEDAPKTRRWKLRARIGPRRKWYQDVEEGEDAF